MLYTHIDVTLTHPSTWNTSGHAINWLNCSKYARIFKGPRYNIQPKRAARESCRTPVRGREGGPPRTSEGADTWRVRCKRNADAMLCIKCGDAIKIMMNRIALVRRIYSWLFYIIQWREFSIDKSRGKIIQPGDAFEKQSLSNPAFITVTHSNLRRITMQFCFCFGREFGVFPLELARGIL